MLKVTSYIKWNLKKKVHIPCSLFLYSHLWPSSGVISLSVPKAALTRPLTNEAAKFCRAESRLLEPIVLPGTAKDVLGLFIYVNEWGFNQNVANGEKDGSGEWLLSGAEWHFYFILHLAHRVACLPVGQPVMWSKSICGWDFFRLAWTPSLKWALGNVLGNEDGRCATDICVYIYIYAHMICVSLTECKLAYKNMQQALYTQNTLRCAQRPFIYPYRKRPGFLHSHEWLNQILADL